MKKSIIVASALTILTTSLAFADGPKKGSSEGKARPVLDKNGDGKITRDEVRALADARFERMDTNKDGVVDAKDERSPAGPHGDDNCRKGEDHEREDHGRRHRGGMGHGGMKHFFEKADANQDGKLSPSEVEAFGKARFAAMDDNKDGFLTQDEVRPKKHEARDAK